ncbi:MAG: hypothetical protein ABFR53_04270 [Actinomycetota bacterium]
MIPTILVVAVPLGIIFGLTHNTRVLAIGSIVTVLGWWALVASVTDVVITPGVLLLGTGLAVVNLGVGVALGWAGARLLRRLFGMTT